MRQAGHLRFLRFLLFFSACLVSFGLGAQLRIEDFTSEWAMPYYRTEHQWMKSSAFFTVMEEEKIVQKRTKDGSLVSVLLDVSSLDLPELSEYALSHDEKKILLICDKESVYRYSYTAQHHIYDTETETLHTLPSPAQAYATFSPDDRHIAFTQDNNLFYYTFETKKTTSVTQDGEKNRIINGYGDWVHEEEFELVQAFSWDARSEKIAFHRFDETRVKEFSMPRWKEGALYPDIYTFKYPKAGEENALVSLRVYALSTRQTQTLNLPETREEVYYPRMQWTESPELLSIRRMNRKQNRLTLLHANVDTGEVKVVLEDSSDTYIDINYVEELHYLKGGTQFIMSSEKTGYKHLYLYDMSGQLIRPLTQGNWEVKTLLGVDERVKHPFVYYLSTEKSYLEQHLFRVDLRGKRKKNLYDESGVVLIDMAPDAKHYVQTFSSPERPPVVSLRRGDGKEIRVLKDSKEYQEAKEKFGFVKKEFFTYMSKDRTTLHGYLLKPKSFTPKEKYPVVVYQYSGPGTQSVRHAWGGGLFFYWHQFLTQQGFIVAVLDVRGGGSRGTAFKKVTYKRLGELECEDHIEAVKYLDSLPFVDNNRVAIWGWSYGGYMSLLALTKGNDMFHKGIAVAPVSSWRFYDTIYTERYLDLPQENEKGYDENSPLSHVDKLKGKLLIVHGTADDNVHFQNALVLQQALVRADKSFSTQYYTNENHSLPKSRKHLFYQMLSFLKGD